MSAKPNSTPWPNATFGTIRGFFIFGVLLGTILGLCLGALAVVLS